MKKAAKALLILAALIYLYCANFKDMTNIPKIELSQHPETGEIIPEEWRDVKGYEKLYKVSNYGRVKRILSVRCLKERLIAPSDNNGYLRANLCKDSKAKPRLVHQLVAIAFIDNPNNYWQINHKKGIRHDNRSWELEWSTPSLNVQHSYDVLHRKVSENAKQYGGKHPASVPIIQYSLNGEFIKEWSSAIEIQRELNLHSPNIIACCRGTRQKTCGGFVFKHKFQRNVRRSRKVQA